MATSRNALEFLRRVGVRPTHKHHTPRLSGGDLRVHSIPLEKSQLNPDLLLDAQGTPPPDRGRLDEWPPPQEVRDDEST